MREHSFNRKKLEKEGVKILDVVLRKYILK